MDEMNISLRRAPDEGKDPRDPAFQAELGQFSRRLHIAGLKVSQRGMAFDSVEHLGYPLPEFTVAFVSGASTVIGAALGAWLKGRYGRKARLKVGDIEAEAQTVEEVEKLLATAQAFQARQELKKIR